MIYAYPRLSKTDLWFTRIGGDGLGNLLFNWARCMVASREHGWRVVWPTWKSHKPKNKRVNPYDHRLYDDLFEPTDEYVHGWRKPLALASRRWVSEQDALADPPRRRCVVQFRGMQGRFETFLGQREWVRERLLAMTRPEHLAGYRAACPAPVSIHVRRGDFAWRPDREATASSDNSALPIEWYVAALEAVRAQARSTLEAWVFSDGTEQELAPLLSMPAVRRMEYGSAIADMLALSRGRLLVASGSTFSMWASWLGQVPTMWYPGKHLQRLHVDSRDTEIEWAEGDVLPAGFLQRIAGTAA